MKQVFRRGVMVLCGLAMAPSAFAESKKFYGYAYDLKTGAYLYTEVYDQEIENGHWMRGGTRYYAPDGHKIGEKKLNFSVSPYIPVYRLDEPDVHYVESITAVSAERVELLKESVKHGRQTDTIERETKTPMAADAGFDSLLIDNFPALLAGQTLSFKLVVAGKLDVYSFRARKLGDVQFDGKPAVQLKVEPDSLLRFAVAPLVLTYDPANKRLLEYRGLSNIIDPATQKVYSARIIYPEKPPEGAPKNLPPLD